MSFRVEKPFFFCLISYFQVHEMRATTKHSDLTMNTHTHNQVKLMQIHSCKNRKWHESTFHIQYNYNQTFKFMNFLNLQFSSKRNTTLKRLITIEFLSNNKINVIENNMTTAAIHNSHH